MVGDEPRPFRRRALRTRDGRGVGHRLQPRELLQTGRSDGQTRYNRDDAIEFKGPEGACVHGENGCGRAVRRAKAAKVATTAKNFGCWKLAVGSYLQVPVTRPWS